MLTHCAAYIGNDSGVTHLAAAAGIPTIAIFGPTDETVWAPPGSHVKIITCAIECRPCSGAQMQRCAEQKCLRGVTLENIVSALPAESVN
jgi:heptosyltransferase-2/heptosyltransferase-3